MTWMRKQIVACFFDEKVETDSEEWEPKEEDIEYFDTRAVIDRILTIITAQTKEARLNERSNLYDALIVTAKTVGPLRAHDIERIRQVDTPVNTAASEGSDGDTMGSQNANNEGEIDDRR